jgi:hypothetical protein
MSRLLEVARQENVEMRIFPEHTRWPFPPYHGFAVYDDRHVVVDLHNTVVVTRGTMDARLYRHVFDAYEESATADIEPIIDRYRRMYLKMAQER